MATLQLAIDADGIALITLNDSTKPMNVVSPIFIDELSSAIERIAIDEAVRGVIITSAKSGFMAGADLKHILSLMESGISVSDALTFSQRPQAMHRRLETCGKPVVAALNGLALGGGFELALACHRRILVDNPRAVVGLPESTVGLLPGSGGTQRLVRLIGTEKALPLLLEGRTLKPGEAKTLGLVDEIVPADRLLAAAKQWLLTSPEAIQPWDRKGYRPTGGLLNPSIVSAMSTEPARWAAKTQRNYPAFPAILDCVFQGAMLPIDKALALESKLFAKLLTHPVARNIVRTTFVNKTQAGKLVRRPAGVPASAVTHLGVLGAGLMGSGIAYVAAVAGIEVVLLDRTSELASRGKEYSAKLLAKLVQKGQKSQAESEAILARIRTTTDYSELGRCSLVIEAVFEDVAIKADVTRKTERVISDSALFASNTSTLPISDLAKASIRPGQFIGLHFFSPVERMPLVEVIVGRETSPTTLAHALDFVAQLRMIPIVVNDARGFYTSRVFQTFIHEGMKMLEDGVLPALIENAAQQAGFPIGPLALLDEVTIELPWKIVQEAETALGDAFVRPCAYEVMRRMLEEVRRPGRRDGGGFYEYPKDAPKQLWSGLAKFFPLATTQPRVEELKKRYLFVQAVEATRCMEEGVVTHPADADLGALLGWSFPSWTGGPLSFIETVGMKQFLAEAHRLTATYGPRFKPGAWLENQARKVDSLYASAA